MSKRKQTAAGDDGEDNDEGIDNIDFDFFDPDPDVDYKAIRTFSKQLFQGDVDMLDTVDLAELILSQPEVGTTVKGDGKESDPLSILTVLNLHTHQSRPFVKTLLDYTSKSSVQNDSVHAALQELLGPAGLQSRNHVGFVFSERFVNMPIPTVPPMYRMLEEELSWAIEDNKPFRFSHLLFIARMYRLSAEEASELEDRSSKRHKPASALRQNDLIPFYPEVAEITQFASHILDFPYKSAQPRDSESFGLDTSLRLMLVPAQHLSQVVQAIEKAYPAP